MKEVLVVIMKFEDSEQDQDFRVESTYKYFAH